MARPSNCFNFVAKWEKKTLFPLKQSQQDYNDSIYLFYVDCEGSVCGFEIIGIQT